MRRIASQKRAEAQCHVHGVIRNAEESGNAPGHSQHNPNSQNANEQKHVWYLSTLTDDVCLTFVPTFVKKAGGLLTNNRTLRTWSPDSVPLSAAERRSIITDGSITNRRPSDLEELRLLGGGSIYCLLEDSCPRSQTRYELRARVYGSTGWAIAFQGFGPVALNLVWGLGRFGYFNLLVANFWAKDFNCHVA